MRHKVEKKSGRVVLDETIGSRAGGQMEGPVPESMLSKREQLRREYICTRAILAHRYPLGRHLIRTGGRRARYKFGFMLTLQRIKFHVPV